MIILSLTAFSQGDTAIIKSEHEKRTKKCGTNLKMTAKKVMYDAHGVKDVEIITIYGKIQFFIDAELKKLKYYK